ncbi:MAG: type I restriction enzyme HsdR N-terminal domain-containing protein [Fluviicola sp.]|nr:type I restriction enzyme HsdR N-terminal domain-containing protein [Fluviicola sp.]
MQALALPKAQLKITKKGNELFVWCVARKKTLVLTPEEWVRQHVIHYLVNDLKVPLGLIASEVSLSINKLSRRCGLL